MQQRLCILYIVINYFYIIIYFRSLSYNRLKNELLIGKGNERVWQQYQLKIVFDHKYTINIFKLQMFRFISYSLGRHGWDCIIYIHICIILIIIKRKCTHILL